MNLKTTLREPKEKLKRVGLTSQARYYALLPVRKRVEAHAAGIGFDVEWDTGEPVFVKRQQQLFERGKV